MWVTWLIIGVVIFDLAFTFFLIWAIMTNTWKPLMKKYPAQEQGEDAVRRNFQSFKFGMISLGCSIHVAADEYHLHLTPASFFRRFGAGAISIPWNSFQDYKRKKGSRWAEVRLDNTRVVGPAWCLELVEPPADNEPQQGDTAY